MSFASSFLSARPIETINEIMAEVDEGTRLDGAVVTSHAREHSVIRKNTG